MMMLPWGKYTCSANWQQIEHLFTDDVVIGEGYINPLNDIWVFDYSDDQEIDKQEIVLAGWGIRLFFF